MDINLASLSAGGHIGNKLLSQLNFWMKDSLLRTNAYKSGDIKCPLQINTMRSHTMDDISLRAAMGCF